MTRHNERLRELRIAAGLTQKQLAEAVNERLGLKYYPETITRTEKDRRDTPARLIVEWCAITGHPDEAAAICAGFGKCHPVTADALNDPGFATMVYQLAKEHQR